VSLGTVPDFAFAGPGMKLDGVVPGSPAEKAGLAKGDVILKLGDVDTPDLRAFSAALKGLAPGSRVKVTYVRDGKQAMVEAEIVARGNP
jgi:S1-C subfamily serine protease